MACFPTWTASVGPLREVKVKQNKKCSLDSTQFDSATDYFPISNEPSPHSFISFNLP